MTTKTKMTASLKTQGTTKKVRTNLKIEKNIGIKDIFIVKL